MEASADELETKAAAAPAASGSKTPPVNATDLRGRTFFVTGANSGIGRALVEALAARGGGVVLATRSEERTRPVLSAIQRRYPAPRAQWGSLDVSDSPPGRGSPPTFLEAGHPTHVSAHH